MSDKTLDELKLEYDIDTLIELQKSNFRISGFLEELTTTN